MRSASACVVAGDSASPASTWWNGSPLAFDRRQLVARAPAAGDLARQLRPHNLVIVIGKYEQRRYRIVSTGVA